MVGRRALPTTKLSNKIKRVAMERTILVFAGRVTAAKGFGTLCKFLEADPGFADRLLVVICGKVETDLRQSAHCLQAAGALVENRFLEDDEVFSLYGVADFVWCVYDESYDQASGVFGRSAQTGCTALVRKGSLLEAMAKTLIAPHVAIDATSDLTKLSMLEKPHKRTEKSKLQSQSLAFGQRALDVVGPKT